MADARRIAAAATWMRRIARGPAMLAVPVLVLLGVAVGQGGSPDQVHSEVTLEVLASPAGAVDVTPDLDGNNLCESGFDVCPFRYAAGTTVKLTARPAALPPPPPPPAFYAWTAAECAAGVTECELHLTGDEPIVSVFALYSPVAMKVAVRGSGKVTWPGGECISNATQECDTADLPAREPIVFTAAPDSGGSTLWAFGCEPVPDDPSRCVALPENRNVGVSFDGTAPEPPFDVRAWIRVSRTGTGSGKITGSDGFNCGGDCRKLIPFGKLVTLNAESAADSRFDGWIGVCGTSPTCRFGAGPVTSVQARFVAAPPPPPPPSPPPPPPPSPPAPPTLQVRIAKLAAFRRAGRWRVQARIAANKPVRVRARVGRLRRTWGDRTANLRAGTSSFTIQLTRRARRGRCWFRLVARTASGEVRTLPQRTVTLGR